MDLIKTRWVYQHPRPQRAHICLENPMIHNNNTGLYTIGMLDKVASHSFGPTEPVLSRSFNYLVNYREEWSSLSASRTAS